MVYSCFGLPLHVPDLRLSSRVYTGYLAVNRRSGTGRDATLCSHQRFLRRSGSESMALGADFVDQHQFQCFINKLLLELQRIEIAPFI